MPSTARYSSNRSPFGFIRRVGSAVRAGVGAWRAEMSGIRANYNAAGSPPWYGNWSAHLAHPDRELQWDYPTLRARIRSEARNNPLVSGYLETAADNIVGWSTIQLQSKVTTRDGTPAEATNREIERGWKEWGRAENCSANRRASFYDIERMAVRVEETDGNAFIRILEGLEFPFGIALQWLDVDQLATDYEVGPDANGVEIRTGVEMDELGALRAFHFYKRHPYDRWGASRERIRVAAEDVIHLGTATRPNQTLYPPRLAAALGYLHMLDGALEADLVGYRMEASQGGVLKATSDEAIAAHAQALRQPGAKAAEPVRLEMNPGMMAQLPPGWEYQSVNPTHPNGNILNFSKIILRAVGRALRVAYITLTGDASDASYTAHRAAMIPERDAWRARQTQLIERLHQRVYRRWVAAALLTGKLRLDSRLAASYHEVVFKPRGFVSIDQLKDAQAYEIYVGRGWMTNAQVCAEHGTDWEENITELAREREMAERLGVPIDGDPAATEHARQTTTAELAAEGARPRLAAV